MKLRAIIPLSLLFALPALGQLVNVAFKKPIEVQYAIEDQAFISFNYSDPNMMVDGKVQAGSFFELFARQAGTAITIALLDTFLVDSFVVRVFPANSLAFRVRGYTLLASLDGILWEHVQSDSNQPLPNVQLDLPTPLEAAFLRFVVTHTDTSINNVSTIIGEIQAFALYEHPGILSMALTPFSAGGTGYQDLMWTSHLMDSTDHVRITYLPEGRDGLFHVAADSTPNDGSFALYTATIHDGYHQVRIEPLLTGKTYPLTSLVEVRSIAALTVDPPQYIHYSTTPATPWQLYDFLPDSLQVAWTLARKWDLPYTYRLSIALDSGRVIVPALSISDSSLRSAWMPVPPLPRSDTSGMVRFEVLYNDTVIAGVNTTPSFMVGSLPPGSSMRWSTESTFRSSGSGSPLWFREHQEAHRLLVGNTWIVDSSGLSVPSWDGKNGMTAISPAVGDLDNDGLPEVVLQSGTNLVAYTLGRVPMAGFQPYGPVGQPYTGSTIQLLDLDGDDTLEICLGHTTGVLVLSNRGVVKANLSVATIVGTAQPAYIDLDGDGTREILLTAGSSLYAFRLNSVLVEGFPISTGAPLFRWVLPVDFDGSGKPDMIVAGGQYIYCFKPDGTLRPGFPRLTQTPMGPVPPAIADIDLDGSLDVVYVSNFASVVPGFTTPRAIGVISHDGSDLPGWPRFAETRVFFKTRSYDVYTTTSIQGALTQPLIASIDGDSIPEILVASTHGVVFAMRQNGDFVEGFPVYLGTETSGSPILGDFDGDGSMNLVLRVDRQQFLKETVINIDLGPGTYNARQIPWPMAYANPVRSGVPAITSHGTPSPELPSTSQLEQNYPNPFNAGTTLRFTMATAGLATLKVFNILGQHVATAFEGVVPEGERSVQFFGEGLTSGVYFVRLTSPRGGATVKIMVLR